MPDQSAEALIRDVDHYLKDEPLEARPDTLLYTLGRFVRRNWQAVSAAHSSSKDHMFRYQPTSQNVAEPLVKNGYVVLGIDNYFNGERKGGGPAGELETMQRNSDQEMSRFKLNLWLGRTLWGMMLRDELIALDYLSSRPEVDPSRIGAQR